MIYNFLKSITRIALKVYFKKIYVKGKENIPTEGPFLIVANHPSSFLDPISIAVLVQQKISFLAGGFMFKNKIVASILKGLNMVPIYRAQDNPNDLTKNKEVFEACFQKLEKKGVIMIFPEGTSENERRLRKVKTGAARIALGTASEYNFNVNVKILPVGLNYTKSSRFKSELFIEFGQPIESEEYFESYKKEERETVKILTDTIEESIKNLIINIDQEEYEDLVTQVESLYKEKLLENEENKFREVEVSKGIYDAINHFQKNENELFHSIKTKIDDYFLNLKEMNLSDRLIEKGGQLKNLWQYILKSFLILALGFPIWLFGYIHSYIPYKLPRFIALKITDSEAFYGALLMSIGTFSFVIFYSLEIYIMWLLTHSPTTCLIYLVALPLAGFFTIFYARTARKFYYNWQFVSKFFNKQQLVVHLIAERNQIISELEALKIKYNQQ